ncbi:putative ryncolin-1-like [Apostichopus japonicus]|uniref:Putative ryncolin-1-like n=1 Tax=Stichopus japonicus TaxID=307972 RepID=A0A2G8JPW3_STIJA|nr:putative ryncolin-1-like [Apostichopus japonicus]
MLDYFVIRVNNDTLVPSPSFVKYILLSLFENQNGESFINSDCTRRSNCSNNQVTLEENYQCSDDATCDERNGIRRCYCNDGYEGDGVECTREMIPKDCKDLLTDDTRDGVYTVYPDNWPNGIQVYCEMESNGGGWTVFQRRSSAAVPFYRGWSEYENGFGNPSEDHWLGNKYIHDITNQKTYELRIDLRNSGSTPYYALYSSFSISDNSDKYRLSIGSYSGDAGKDAMSFSNNKQFSTKDQDYDGWSSYDCAEGHRGAWWFAKQYRCRDHNSSSYCRTYYCPHSNYCEAFPIASDDCVHCADAHLNAEYDGSTRGTNIFWEDISGDDCGLRFTEMKIRPV